MDFSTINSTDCLPFRNFPGSSLGNNCTLALGRAIRVNWLCTVMGLVTWDPLIHQEQVFALGGASRMAFLPLLQAEQPYFYLVCVLGFHEQRWSSKYFHLGRVDAQQIRRDLSHYTLTCTFSVSVLHVWFLFKNRILLPKILFFRWFLNLWPKTLGGSPYSPEGERETGTLPFELSSMPLCFTTLTSCRWVFKD